MAASPSDPDRAAPMSSAPFVWREDGRPDWGAMWSGFCELALHGGPPHRGPEQALHGPGAGGAEAGSEPAMVAEIRRGIWETTGLFSEQLEAGWIAVTCDSRAMAGWLGATISLENVEARVDEDRVLLPAGPHFRLDDQVKSIITVVAKTHHYGAMHGGVAMRPDGPEPATNRHGFGCPACGVQVEASRPAAVVSGEATCPVDGAPMARRDLAGTRRRAAFWHTHAPGEPLHPHEALLPGEPGRAGGSPGPLRVGVEGAPAARAALIDALRRRYGRRRAIAVRAAQALEPSDPAVDLVLVEGSDGTEAGLGASTVDATIGLLCVPVLAAALERGDRSLQTWRLLVVSTAREAREELARLEDEACRQRGQRPVVFADLARAGGIDGVASWLERELGLPPWRPRPGRPGPPSRPSG